MLFFTIFHLHWWYWWPAVCIVWKQGLSVLRSFYVELIVSFSVQTKLLRLLFLSTAGAHQAEPVDWVVGLVANYRRYNIFTVYTITRKKLQFFVGTLGTLGLGQHEFAFGFCGSIISLLLFKHCFDKLITSFYKRISHNLHKRLEFQILYARSVWN